MLSFVFSKQPGVISRDYCFRGLHYRCLESEPQIDTGKPAFYGKIRVPVGSPLDGIEATIHKGPVSKLLLPIVTKEARLPDASQANF